MSALIGCRNFSTCNKWIEQLKYKRYVKLIHILCSFFFFLCFAIWKVYLSIYKFQRGCVVTTLIYCMNQLFWTVFIFLFIVFEYIRLLLTNLVSFFSEKLSVIQAEYLKIFKCVNFENIYRQNTDQFQENETYFLGKRISLCDVFKNRELHFHFLEINTKLSWFSTLIHNSG